MRLTSPLLISGNREVWEKFFYWGKGFGTRQHKDRSIRRYKDIWFKRSKIQIRTFPTTLPPNVEVIDPIEYVKAQVNKDIKPCERNLDFTLPWPYNERPIRGSPTDPNYHDRTALTFNRKIRLYDPLNQAQVFTNSIIENTISLPDCVEQLSNEDIDDHFLDLAQRRLNWCLHSDGMIAKLPRQRLFPYLDQKPKRLYGIPFDRKETNVMNTLHDLSSIYIASKFGFTDMSKLASPHCLINLERDGKLIVMNLECDFVTTAKSDYSLPLFSNTPLTTIDRPLASIYPLSWTTCFEASNIYQVNYGFKLPPTHKVHTIFLSRHHIVNVSQECLAGRAIMACYGYAIGQARNIYGSEIDDMELPDPITIQCVFHNPVDLSLGFVCFQLNTTSFNSPLKNQIWLDGPHIDRKIQLQKLIALELNGHVDQTSLKLKRPINSALNI